MWFFLPAGLANASPVLANRINFLNILYKPLDLGLKIRGRRVFGDNKTWLGLIFAVLVGFIVISLQRCGYNHFEWIRNISGTINYNSLKVLWLGPLLGFGALAGDAIESFFKRQIGIKPGHTWFPFDQVDYILGALIFSLVIVTLSGFDYVLIIIIWVLIHLLSSYIGFLIGWKSKPI
jgi:CDP-2,3-bis-(O-geranylgeranyl)-sn-glycerol synthase